MSKSAAEFVLDSRSDSELKQKIMGDQALSEVDITQVVTIANTLGYEFTQESLETALVDFLNRDDVELTPEELDLVSAGEGC